MRAIVGYYIIYNVPILYTSRIKRCNAIRKKRTLFVIVLMANNVNMARSRRRGLEKKKIQYIFTHLRKKIGPMYYK